MQRCEITGTGIISGNQISHSHRLTRRVWKPNLQVTTIVVNGSPVKVKVCSRTLKTLRGASEVEVMNINNVDSTLETLDNVISSDAIILDKCKSWININREILDKKIENNLCVDFNL